MKYIAAKRSALIKDCKAFMKMCGVPGIGIQAGTLIRSNMAGIKNSLRKPCIRATHVMLNPTLAIGRSNAIPKDYEERLEWVFPPLFIATRNRPRKMAMRVSGTPMKGTAEGGGLTVVVVVVE